MERVDVILEGVYSMTILFGCVLLTLLILNYYYCKFQYAFFPTLLLLLYTQWALWSKIIKFSHFKDHYEITCGGLYDVRKADGGVLCEFLL